VPQAILALDWSLSSLKLLCQDETKKKELSVAVMLVNRLEQNYQYL
jgi:hypothetical protein